MLLYGGKRSHTIVSQWDTDLILFTFRSHNYRSRPSSHTPNYYIIHKAGDEVAALRTLVNEDKADHRGRQRLTDFVATAIKYVNN